MQFLYLKNVFGFGIILLFELFEMKSSDNI